MPPGLPGPLHRMCGPVCRADDRSEELRHVREGLRCRSDVPRWLMSMRTKEAPMPNAETSNQKWLLQIRRGELRLINELSELIRLILERRVDRKALLFKITEEP